MNNAPILPLLLPFLTGVAGLLVSRPGRARRGQPEIAGRQNRRCQRAAGSEGCQSGAGLQQAAPLHHRPPRLRNWPG